MSKILEPFKYQAPITTSRWTNVGRWYAARLGNISGAVGSEQSTEEKAVRLLLWRMNCEVIMLVGYSDE